MLIHAFRRTAAVTVNLLSQDVEFSPNERGDVVADVADAEVAERLLEISEGYRAYESESDDESDDEAGSLMLTNGDETIDIGAMTANQVRAMADEAGVELPSKGKVAELRKALFEALSGAGA